MRKKTHEQFLISLYEKNEHYRNGEFKIIGNYRGNKSRILVEDRYGKCLITPNTLLNKGSKPNINSAIDKTSYWKNMCLDRFGKEGNDDLSQVEYTRCDVKVKILDHEFGEYWIIPSSYYGGSRSKSRAMQCLYENSRHNQKEVFDKIRKLHPDLEILPNQEYINRDGNLLVKNKYGICEVIILSLLNKSTPTIRSAVDKNLYCINQFKEVHGDKYDYSLVEYKGTHTKVKIISEHGIFEQSPSNHLSRQGCPIEGRKNTTRYHRKNPSGWKHRNWIKSGGRSKRFDSFKVYFLECWDEETGERFYKIGKTYNTVKRRFRTKTRLPYKYNIIYTIELEDGRRICELEQEYQNKNKEYSYIPKKHFDGMYECFSKLIEI